MSWQILQYSNRVQSLRGEWDKTGKRRSAKDYWEGRVLRAPTPELGHLWRWASAWAGLEILGWAPLISVLAEVGTIPAHLLHHLALAPALPNYNPSWLILVLISFHLASMVFLGLDYWGPSMLILWSTCLGSILFFFCCFEKISSAHLSLSCVLWCAGGVIAPTRLLCDLSLLFVLYSFVFISLCGWVSPLVYKWPLFTC